jgi:hypothetical protein
MSRLAPCPGWTLVSVTCRTIAVSAPESPFGPCGPGVPAAPGSPFGPCGPGLPCGSWFGAKLRASSEPGLTFAALIAPFRICFAPTLFAGRTLAA